MSSFKRHLGVMSVVLPTVLLAATNVLAQNAMNVAPAMNEAPVDGAAPAMSVAQQRVLEFRNQPRSPMPVRVTRAAWTPEMETRFSAFVQQVGRGIARRPMGLLSRYMRDPSVNPYASQDPEGIVLYSDCADFPYFLRAYFAYHNGLPMSVSHGVTMNMAPFASEANRQGDLATARLDDSPYGNAITGRVMSNVASAPGRERNFIDYWSNMIDAVSTRTLRVGPLTPGYELSDLYPVRINRQGVRAGTVVHSNGHALIVYDVLANGTVMAMDAHPDNSNQIKRIDASNLNRSRPDHGFGFFNFRPLRVVGGQVAANGAIYGGRVQPMSDQELFAQGLYSLEQWFGPESNFAPGAQVSPTAWRTAFRGIDFFDFLRMRMRAGNGPQPSDDAIGEAMVQICDLLKMHESDTNEALRAGIHRQPHPSVLPQNIFSTEGDWEAFSTPSRDGRMRFAAADLPRQAVQKFKQGTRGQFGLRFTGTAVDFQRAIVNRLALLNATCQVTYARSNNTRVTMNFSSMIRRMPRMSFDPYHCSEKRWGATSVELSTCVDGDAGNVWYIAQQSMRNTVGKQDENERLVVRSTRPITLEMLNSRQYLDQPSSALINLGSARTPIVDLEAYFASPQFVIDLNR